MASPESCHICTCYGKHPTVNHGLDGRINEGRGRSVRIQINHIKLIPLLRLWICVVLKPWRSTSGIHYVRGVSTLDTDSMFRIIVVVINENRFQAIKGNIFFRLLDRSILEIVDDNLANARNFLPVPNRTKPRSSECIKYPHPTVSATFLNVLRPVYRFGILIKLSLDLGFVYLGGIALLARLTDQLLLLGLDRLPHGSTLGVHAQH
mmetsp:Transcript_39802/g.81890  ORF Transcript_39802/g.81890 Transcript_39802/m.81890 type:complete len:207 (-) Transcript_39802:641-1261(-)